MAELRRCAWSPDCCSIPPEGQRYCTRHSPEGPPHGVREQSALELLETHAQAQQAEIERLRAALEGAETWRDYYRAKWLGQQAVPERPAPETAGCREHAAWEHVKALQCPVCKELRPAVETGACNHHFSELLASKDNAFEMRQCLECAKIFRVRLPEKTEGSQT